ncbi:hypothetical protein [Agromyces larvae]|uniref:Uncharacterized protein n=1 Tax=Agromyces larvae TaxID=2929802 RepID=A0ABY4BXQ6_9MICO|nr:hypothetical protein [Agromyces larvae]UOE42977.1 hypothetical protein MTO99_12345 [Agromyces larvae]
MKTRRRPYPLAVASAILAIGLAVTASTPAVAAETRWYNGKTSPDTKYTEGTVYQSRDGIRAGFTETTPSGLIKLEVWFGGYTTSAWDYQVSIGGPRTYEKGALRWTSPAVGSSEKIDSVPLSGRVG